MLTTTQKKSLILESARERQKMFMNGPRTTFHKCTALDTIMGMQTVVALVFGQESELWKELDAIWFEIHQVPAEMHHG